MWLVLYINGEAYIITLLLSAVERYVFFMFELKQQSKNLYLLSLHELAERTDTCSIRVKFKVDLREVLYETQAAEFMLVGKLFV